MPKLDVEVVVSISVTEELDRALEMGEDWAHEALRVQLSQHLEPMGLERIEVGDMGPFNVSWPSERE